MAIDRQEANAALQQAGLSPLHNLRRIERLEALPLLKTSRYDLVLVDFEMPVLDGRKLVHFALQAGVAPKQIVLLSGHEADLLHEICPAGVCLAVLNKFEERQREVLDMILVSLSSKAGKDTPDVC